MYIEIVKLETMFYTKERVPAKNSEVVGNIDGRKEIQYGWGGVWEENGMK